ncbi:DUF1666 family protein [Actinidia rufa]|uniref:DUF1666 family protein n=1 Tax=Actinidia rufa TaxID=165716 RepID=A0A7J0G116_9ERIC|nr:DUF1666 family protein [Actinidia rufa]
MCTIEPEMLKNFRKCCERSLDCWVLISIVGLWILTRNLEDLWCFRFWLKILQAHKPNPEKDSEEKPIPQPEEPKNENSEDLGKSVNVDPAAEAEDDDDDDFIMSEVKRRLKDLRKNSFMVLIPEESGLEEEEGETSSSEWRDVEAEGQLEWFGFDAVYDKYCEQMLFFDRLIAQQLKKIGNIFL